MAGRRVRSESSMSREVPDIVVGKVAQALLGSRSAESRLVSNNLGLLGSKRVAVDHMIAKMAVSPQLQSVGTVWYLDKPQWD